MSKLLKRRLTWNGQTCVDKYETEDGGIETMYEAEAKNRQWVKPTPVVQDMAYWLKSYPDGNFPLGIDP